MRAAHAALISTFATTPLLQKGELVGVFPEGTRVRDGIGEPKRGAARLCKDAKVPMIPMAMVGTEKGALKAALWHRGERVRMQVGIPVYPAAHQEVDELTHHRLWPQATLMVKSLERHRKAATVGVAGSTAGTLIVFLSRKSHKQGTRKLIRRKLRK